MGFAIAKHLKNQGEKVVICSRNLARLEKAQQNLGDVEIHAMDMTDEKQIQGFFEKMSPFNHLVITAAGHFFGLFKDFAIEEGKKFFANKFWGQYLIAKYALTKIKKGGTITFFSGLASVKPLEGFACGAAINGAIESLTRTLAVELAPIRVNAISPGVIDTPAWSSLPQEEKEKQFTLLKETLPVKKVGSPEDVAFGVEFLIRSSYTTGLVLYIDGGQRLI